MTQRSADTRCEAPFEGANEAATGLALHELPARRAARVQRVDTAAAQQPPERARELADIGFVPGEHVSILARAWPGGDPLVVRVGHSSFALRRAEAACVRVQPLPEAEAHAS